MNDTLPDLARDAYIWGIPLVQTRIYKDLAKEQGLPFNQLFCSQNLSDPQSDVPLPNVDTLYGIGWLDVTHQPQILSVPDTHDRYYLIQLNDAYMNSFHYIGRRATGTKAREFAIVSPDWSGELNGNITLIRSPTNHVLALTRVVVLDDTDLADARKVQDNFLLTPLSSYPDFISRTQPIKDAFNIFPILKPSDLGVKFFDELSMGLAENPPPKKEEPFVKRLQALGIVAGRKTSEIIDAEQRSLLAEAACEGEKSIHGRGGWLIDTRDVNGWKVSYGMTSFISDPLDRAVVAKLGPGCLIPQEGLYFSLQHGPDEKFLSGDNTYILEFPEGDLPPVDAFWSLTLYGKDFALVDNPIDRYAIGDRTKNLKFESDGTLRIYIQHEMPEQGPSNWLPAPKADFHLFMRTYQPKERLSNGSYRMPGLLLA